MFDKISIGASYSRPDLADIWGYASFHAIARGVVTPTGTNKIILFVTEEKQSDHEQYEDRMDNGRLSWEGPTDHFAERRMVNTAKTGDEIHLFHRFRHHSDFVYIGQLELLSYVAHANNPSSFTFKIR